MSVWAVGSLAVGAYGAYSSSKAAKDAGKAQAQATGDANQIIRENFLDTKATLNPYVQSGAPALDRRSVLLGLKGTPEQRQAEWGKVYADPVLTDLNKEVIGATNRSAAASGVTGGNRLAALTDRLQRLKYGFGQDYMNRLDTAVNTGYGAAAATGGVAANAANTQASNVIAGGTARANSIVNSNNAFQSGLADIYGTARDAWGK